MTNTVLLRWARAQIKDTCLCSSVFTLTLFVIPSFIIGWSVSYNYIQNVWPGSGVSISVSVAIPLDNNTHPCAQTRHAPASCVTMSHCYQCLKCIGYNIQCSNAIANYFIYTVASYFCL